MKAFGVRSTVAGVVLGAMAAFASPASADIIVHDSVTFTTSGVLVDFWSLNVSQAGTVSLDMRSEHGGIDLNGDGFSSFFDIFITIARDDGSLTQDDVLFQSDDHGGVIDGSTHNYDSFLSQYLNVGNYIFMVANCCDFGANTILDGIQNEGSDYTNSYAGWSTHNSAERGYQITGYGDATFTLAGLTNVATGVPAPGALALLGLGLLGIGGLRRKLKAA